MVKMPSLDFHYFSLLIFFSVNIYFCFYEFKPDRNQETRVFFLYNFFRWVVIICVALSSDWRFCLFSVEWICDDLDLFYIVRCFPLFRIRELFFIFQFYITYDILELKAFSSFLFYFSVLCQFDVSLLREGFVWSSFHLVIFLIGIL